MKEKPIKYGACGNHDSRFWSSVVARCHFSIRCSTGEAECQGEVQHHTVLHVIV
jgi:hypothetical protein